MSHNEFLTLSDTHGSFKAKYSNFAEIVSKLGPAAELRCQDIEVHFLRFVVTLPAVDGHRSFPKGGL